MDFQSLSRKELQALCKKNKIPANMTNIAMADALTALDKVEGLDEFTKSPKFDSQLSPEKAMAGSPENPQTSCRTSTRNKPLFIEPDSSQQPLTRTRSTTRRVVGEGDRENKNANYTNTPAMPASRIRTSGASARRKMEAKMMESVEDQEKNNLSKTPAAQSSRRMTAAVSARRKVEAKKEEVSVQRVYSTRHSVRLLEKSVEELSIKEKGSVRPLKMDGLCKEIEDVEMEEESGSDLLTVPEKSSEKTIDTEADHSLEDKREIKHELQDESNSDVYEVEHCNAKQEIGSENCKNSEVLPLDNESEMTNELEEDNKNNVDHCNPKLEGLNEQDEDSNESWEKSNSNESWEKSNPILVERSDNAVPINQEPIYEKGTVKSGVMVSGSPTLKVSEFVDQKSEMISKEEKQQRDNYDLRSNFETEGESDSHQSDEATENGKEETVPEDDSYKKTESSHETESCQSITRSSSTSKFPDYLVTGNLGAPAPSKDISVKNNNEALVDIHVMEAEELDMKTHEWHTSCVSDENPGYVNQMTSSCTLASDNDSGKILLHKVHDDSSAESLVDITVMSLDEFAMAAAPALGKTPESLVDITVMSQDEFAMAAAPALGKTPSPYQPLVVGGAISGRTCLSPFAADVLQGQFPRPTELIPKKSSTKKQPKIWKMIDAVEFNKENIDNSGKKVEPKKEKSDDEVILDEISLRQLRKMMKEKLQIANNKNSEEDNDTKVGKTRLALQSLADENRSMVLNQN